MLKKQIFNNYNGAILDSEQGHQSIARKTLERKVKLTFHDDFLLLLKVQSSEWEHFTPIVFNSKNFFTSKLLKFKIMFLSNKYPQRLAVKWRRGKSFAVWQLFWLSPALPNDQHPRKHFGLFHSDLWKRSLTRLFY